MLCDIVMIMDAIDKQDTEADAINVSSSRFQWTMLDEIK